MDRLLHIDRRWIFLLILLAVFVPFLTGLTLPVGTPGPATRDVHQFVEKLPPGSVILMAFDYGPASMPELQPMAVAVARQAFKRKLRVVCMTLNPQGFLLADRAMARAAAGSSARYGVDYVNLGFKPGYIAVIQSIGSNLPGLYAQDAKGTPTAGMKIMAGLDDYSDIALVMDLASSNSPGAWVAFAHEKYKVPVAAGITAVMATEYYPFYQSKQVVGLLNGLKGAAEYESLIGQPDMGTLGMASQSIAHAVIILFVILGNIGYFAHRRRQRRQGGTPR